MASDLCSTCGHHRPHVIKCGANMCRSIGEHGGPESPRHCRYAPKIRDEPVSSCVNCGMIFSTASLDNGYCPDCLRAIYSI